jgi:hypothetical protein
VNVWLRELVLAGTVVILLLICGVQLRRREPLPPTAAMPAWVAEGPRPPPQPPAPPHCGAAGVHHRRRDHLGGHRRGRRRRPSTRASIPLLDSAALETVKRRKFTPAVWHGAPMCVTMTLTVSFR